MTKQKFSQVKSLSTYFNNSKNTSHLHRITCDTEVNCTPLTICEPLPQYNENIKMTREKVTMWKSKHPHGRQAYDLETPDVNKIASNAWLMVDKLFPETTGFMMTTHNHIISTNNYKQHISNNYSITNNICKKC
jgi:hypothetical protein